MIITPYISVDNLFFTDSRVQLREKIRKDFEEGKKGEADYDYFKGNGLFVFYDNNGKIDAFEFFEANPVFQNVDLLSITWKQLLDFFQAIDINLEIDYNQFTSYKFGIGGNTNDDPDFDNAMPEAIIIFRKGYYDLLQG
jgi:hypothetical protein